MRRFEILKRGSSTQVEGVLADAAIARTGPLTARDVREAVLDGHSLSQSLPPPWRSDEMAKPLLECLVRSDANLTTSVRCLRAFRSGGASAARPSVEADGRVELKPLGLALWTRNRAVANVDVEVRLGEQTAV